MTARLLQILLQTNRPGPPRPFPKTQLLICIMRGNGGRCLLIIKMHLFTGGRPVAPTWFTPALSYNPSQGSGGGASPQKERDDLWKSKEFSDSSTLAAIKRKEQMQKWNGFFWCRGAEMVARRWASWSPEEGGEKAGPRPGSACVSSDMMEQTAACVHSLPNSSHHDAAVCCGPAAPPNVTCLG